MDQLVSLSGDNCIFVLSVYGLVSRAQKLPPGTLTTVGLSVEKTDRSNLREKCIEKDEEFERIYNWSYTNNNCRMVQSHKLTNCSLGMMAGIKSSDPNKRHCMPMDQLFGDLNYEDAGDYDYDVSRETCHYECETKEYKTLITSGIFDYRPMAKLTEGMMKVIPFDMNDPFIQRTVMRMNETFEYVLAFFCTK